MTDFPTGLEAVADKYDVILCDVWGVIHNGRRAFTQACEALAAFRETGKPVILITNAPVPKAQVIRYFEPLGVPENAFDDCVSSGDATREELAKRKEQKIWRLGADHGWENDRFLYEGLDLDFTEPDEADVLLCVGLRDQNTDDPEDYREELLANGVANGLPMICANPDIQVRIGGELVWCAGALARIYEKLGGSVIYPGKPYDAIYDLAMKKVKEIGAERPRSVLCIGDSPATDIKGARKRGYDSLYVGTGLKEHGTDFEAETLAHLAEYGEAATYALPGLKW